MEFHISRQARERYQFEQSLFSFDGNVIFANFHAARLFAQKINQKRDLAQFPENAVRAGHLNAFGLIDEIFHAVMLLYRQRENPDVLPEALTWLAERVGPAELDHVLLTFTREFPPTEVFNRQVSAEAYLAGKTGGVPNRELVIEELLLLYVANQNPAIESMKELFDDRWLERDTAYGHVVHELGLFFENQPPFGPDRSNLVEMLRSPALAVPQSISGQLDYIRENWSELLGRFLYRLLSSMDFLREEEKVTFMGPGPVPIPVYDQAALAASGETERFSPDREWMPRLVLMAKNTYVWLDQLSKAYGRPIVHLDQIPDEELDRLAQAGFTGLWLIGLWERSQASARIKQLCGNPEAISSAYSLTDYTIAEDLGGDGAWDNLRHRAWQRGIRLASDMVPNHMGIDSKWVIDHPDWFISVETPPFPAYSFNGPNLSPVSQVGIQIEDHYYDRTDAAVVFKRQDYPNGRTQYIYHGNDGTSMPWNDTAQLNYLNPEVREAVIQTILAVARQFPIIRFDAAMTLAKKHYQRLWFPEPGSGGDIPSRAGLGLTHADFNAAMPVEFWREVVDRVAAEAPDTLLLAEAFWLMEGYFVRTLGMHRVYNSAFMNLLRNEENDRYRAVMKNTLEFDPEILKRYVNFMNNPDERTAVDQFGKGDKYFGICVLMATMPGLPMFGHGQIEGFSEKYGMEFRRAYWDERPDPQLVARHEREIFPLLHRRALFAGVEHFLLFDFFAPDGSVNENVYAFSNGLGSERALVVFHNRFGSAQGWVRTSVGFAGTSDGERRILRQTLGEGLGLHPDENMYVIFREWVTGQEFIRSSEEICRQGLEFHLNAYEYHVFLDFREIRDDENQSYRHLCAYLNGRGVPSIEESLTEIMLLAVQTPFRHIANPGYFGYLLSQRCQPDRPCPAPEVLNEAREKTTALLNGITYLTHLNSERETLLAEVRAGMEALLRLGSIESRFPFPASGRFARAAAFLQSGAETHDERWLALFGWLFTHRLGRLTGEEACAAQSVSWLVEWQFGRILQNAYQEMGLDEAKAWRTSQTVRLLVGQQDWFKAASGKRLPELLQGWLADEDIRAYLGVNRYQNILWYNKEALDDFAWYMLAVAYLRSTSVPQIDAARVVEDLIAAYEIIERLLSAAALANYQVDRLIAAAEDQSMA